jgi:aspartate/methionine/tyrosine aminotransferase
MWPLPEFRLESWFARWEFSAPYNLAASDAESLAVSALLDLAAPSDREAWASLRLGYTETRGAPALRDAIAATYESVQPEQVLCFTGGEEGIFCAMHALLDRADHAIVLVPNYQSMEALPQALCEVTGVALRERESWRLDLDDIRAALRPNTRVIAVNFPNNPTGHVIPVDDLRALGQLADDRGIWLFADEVYRGLERPHVTSLPQAVDVCQRGLSLNVLSKACGLPGLRTGWIACRDRELVGKMERIKHYLSICSSAPSEVLALAALHARNHLLVRNRAIIAENLPVLGDFFARHAELFEWSEPQGGCVGYPRYRGGEGVEAFCRSAVEQSGVLLLPASIFASRLLVAPTDRFRIGFGRRDLPLALLALEGHLAAHRFHSAPT